MTQSLTRITSRTRLQSSRLQAAPFSRSSETAGIFSSDCCAAVSHALLVGLISEILKCSISEILSISPSTLLLSPERNTLKWPSKLLSISFSSGSILASLLSSLRDSMINDARKPFMTQSLTRITSRTRLQSSRLHVPPFSSGSELEEIFSTGCCTAVVVGDDSLFSADRVQ